MSAEPTYRGKPLPNALNGNEKPEVAAAKLVGDGPEPELVAARALVTRALIEDRTAMERTTKALRRNHREELENVEQSSDRAVKGALKLLGEANVELEALKVRLAEFTKKSSERHADRKSLAALVYPETVSKEPWVEEVVKTLAPARTLYESLLGTVQRLVRIRVEWEASEGRVRVEHKGSGPAKFAAKAGDRAEIQALDGLTLDVALAKLCQLCNADAVCPAQARAKCLNMADVDRVAAERGLSAEAAADVLRAAQDPLVEVARAEGIATEQARTERALLDVATNLHLGPCLDAVHVVVERIRAALVTSRSG